MRLLKASLLKLVRRPATWRTWLVVAACMTFIYLAMAIGAARDPESSASTEFMLTFPGAHTGLAGLLMVFAGIAGAGYAGTVAASEWSWGSFRVALTRGESRGRYVVGLFVAIALVALVAWLALYVVGIGVITASAMVVGVPTGDPLNLANPAFVPVLVACGAWAVTMQVAIAFSVSFISRSAVAGIGVVAGLLLVEQLAAMIVPADLLRLAPTMAASGLLAAAGSVGLDANFLVPFAVTTVYVLLAIGIAAAVGRRAQVA